MTGSWRVVVTAVRPFTIHGDLYWELQVSRLESPGEPKQDVVLRVPQHAAKTEPAVGQMLSVSFLMGQVTGLGSG